MVEAAEAAGEVEVTGSVLRFGWAQLAGNGCRRRFVLAAAAIPFFFFSSDYLGIVSVPRRMYECVVSQYTSSMIEAYTCLL